MKAKNWKLRLSLLACGAIPLITNVNCDPARGIFDFYRDDDASYFFDDYDDYYYDDYYDDEIIIFDDYDDCFFGCF